MFSEHARSESVVVCPMPDSSGFFLRSQSLMGEDVFFFFHGHVIVPALWVPVGIDAYLRKLKTDLKDQDKNSRR
jgi:hypothetical protein